MYEGPLREPRFVEREAAVVSPAQATRSRPLIPLIAAGTVAIALGALDSLPATATGTVRISWQSTSSVSLAVGQWLGHVEEIGRVACEAVAEGLRVVGRDTVVSLGSVPQGALTEEGTYQLVWDHGRHHLLAEILPTGRYDWFYRDRETGRLDGEEDLPFVETAKLRRRLGRNMRSKEA